MYSVNLNLSKSKMCHSKPKFNRFVIHVAHLCLLKVHSRETGRWKKLCDICETIYCFSGMVSYNFISNVLRASLYIDNIVDIVCVISSTIFWSIFIQQRFKIIYYIITKVSEFFHVLQVKHPLFVTIM